MIKKLKTLIDNFDHTHSKLGMFIETALRNSAKNKKEWREGIGEFQAAKQKYLLLYEEIHEIERLFNDVGLKDKNSNLLLENLAYKEKIEKFESEVSDMAMDIGCHLRTISELEERNRLLQTAAHKLINVMGE